MRKLALPALVACALLAASAPVATAKPVKAHAAASLGSKLSTVSGALKGLAKAVSQIKDVNSGQTAAIHQVDTRVTTVVADLTALSSKVTAIVTVATDSLTKLQAGLTSLAAAVQGPNIAGQLGAAGSALPGAANTATPDTLPAGTVYRQIVVSGTTPLGVRLWVKSVPPATTALPNHWVCVSAKTDTAIGAPATSADCTVTSTG